MGEKFRFTKTRVEALPPADPGKRDEYRDEAQPGLWLRVSAAGVKTYAVLARKKGGGLERITIGTADKLTPENARTEAKQIIADLARGISHAAPARAARGEVTFGDLFADYLADRSMKPRSRLANSTTRWMASVSRQAQRCHISSGGCSTRGHIPSGVRAVPGGCQLPMGLRAARRDCHFPAGTPGTVMHP